MPILTDQNIEAELSYAYLHAVAARAGMSCEVTGRHLDNAGVDAAISARDQFAADSIWTDITVHVQLKATVAVPADDGRRFSYFMKDVARYNRLRVGKAVPPKILVVLFLPQAAEHWLALTEEQLILKRCAYWVSLVGAAASTNDSGQTVYLPKVQVFSPECLRQLVTQLSRGSELKYEQ
jgi:hypothetical protein